MADGASSRSSRDDAVEALAKGAAPNGAAPYVPGVRSQRQRPGRRVMPSDFSIAFEIGNGASKPGVERGPRRQSMRGFEDTYVDIVDYIVRITHRIWEDQDVGYIYDTYAPAAASTTTAARGTASSRGRRARSSGSAPSPTCATTPTT